MPDTGFHNDGNHPMFSVLYVDDEEGLLEITKLFLEKDGGFKVATAISAQKALDSPALPSYDVIVSDYQMPGMDGIAFLKAVRERFGDIPFILFTGRGREEVVISAINNGADFYLQKGGDPRAQFAELAHKIRQAVRRKQAERSHFDSERRLSDIIGFLPDPTFAIDRSGKVIAWNRAIEEMTGIPAIQMLGRGDYEYAVPFYGSRRPILIDLIDVPDEKITRFYTNIYRTGTSLTAETDLPHPKGHRITALAKACHLYNQAGEVTGAIESIRDITELKRAGQELQKSEERFRGMAERSSDLIIILNEKMSPTYVSPSARAIIGYDPEELVGNPPEFASATIFARTGPELMNAVKSTIKGLTVENVELRISRKDTTPVYVSMHVVPVLQDGVFDGAQVSMRDITAKKNAEIALRESENKFATVFNSSPVSLTLVSVSDGTFTDVNDAFLLSTGYSRNEVIGVSPESIGLFPDRNEYDCFISGLRERREVHGMELKCQVKSGEIRTCRFSSRIITMSARPYILSSVEDITEWKATESAIQAIVKSIVGTTGLDALRKITENISSWLSADCVMVGEIQPDRQTVKVLFMLLDGKEIYDFSYSLKGTPCENVAEKGYCLYPDDAVRLFPESRDLVELNIRGYVGTPLRDSHGEVSGILCALSRSPLQVLPSVREIMDIIAVKAAAELERIRIEGALRESEEKFRSIVETSPDMIWEIDLQGNFRYISPMVTAIMGYSPAELIGRSIADLVPEHARSSSMNKWAKAISSEGPPSPIEITAQHRNGRELITEIRPVGLFGNDGTLKGFRGVTVDITERRRAEEALKDSEEKFRSIVETSPNIIWEIDPRGTFRYVSPTIATILGYNPEEVIGKLITDLVTEKGTSVSEEALSRIISSGDVPSPVEIPARHRDGREILLEIRPSLTGTDEKPAVLRGVAVDITERRRAEEALKESRHLLAEAMDLANLVNWEYDPKTNLFIFNDRFYALYGTTAEREGGYQMAPEHYIREFVHTDDREAVAAVVEKGRVSTDPHLKTQMEHRIIRRDGEIRYIMVRMEFMKDADGNTIIAHGANQDITERKMAEEAISRANRQLSLLGGITRHDILNKVAIILGYLRIAEMKFPDPELADLLKKIEFNTGVIRSQIEFTKVYRNLGTHEPQWIDLDTALPRSQVPVTITLRADVTGISLYADPMLEKVFFNLLDNSIRHGKRVTEIRISSRTEGKYLIITWEDNGVGIAADENERIFERGFGKNTGLGMFLVREVLSLTELTITESGEPGKGARFEIRVPEGMWRMSGRGK